MDNTAIKQIQDTAVAATRLPGEAAGLAVVLPQGYNAQSIEKFLPGRSRKKGTVATGTLADFCIYTKQNPGGQCFIDADVLSATTFFDIGKDTITGLFGHCDHRAELTMKASAPFAALLAMAGKRQGQKELAEWIEDWNGFLSAVSENGESMALSAAVAAIRDMKITATTEATSVVGAVKSSRSTFEQVDANSRATLPAGFTFTCTPYLGLRPREFPMRLAVIAGDKPALVLRIVAFEAIQEAIALEFKEILFRELGEAAAVYIGTFEP